MTEDSGYFTQYLVTIKNTSENGAEAASQAALNIALTGVSITSDSNHASLANWTRVAINTNVERFNENGKYLTPKSTGTNKTYLFQNEIKAGVSDQFVNDQKDNFKGPNGTMSQVLDTCDPSLTANVNVADDSWKNVQPGHSIIVGVSVWMEGTMDVQDDAKGGSISVALTFSSTNI